MINVDEQHNIELILLILPAYNYYIKKTYIV